jgi:hypothetical protein
MMTGRTRLLVAAIPAGAAVTTAGSAAMAGGGDSQGEENSSLERLTGYEENSLALSTTGTGLFQAQIDEDRQEISYRLSYTSG